MSTPAFWQHKGVAARLLSPLGAAVGWVTALRVARPGWRAPVPVICCGNAGVGGTGKTTLVLDLVARLQHRELLVHCLTRGYGGTARGPLLVDPLRHGAELVGDEPLLLAAVAPTWVGGDRAASARLAVGAGAQVLLMDDGLQNPGLVQDAALLVIDGAVGFGNGMVVPAGPLRESVARAAARCRAAVLIGADQAGAERQLPGTLTILRAGLVPERRMHGRRVVAFAGIGRPGKFYETLEAAGATVTETMDFADHHVFTDEEINALVARAFELQATPVTTPKDAARLGGRLHPAMETVGVRLAWENQIDLESLLDTVVGPGSRGSRAATVQ